MATGEATDHGRRQRRPAGRLPSGPLAVLAAAAAVAILLSAAPSRARDGTALYPAAQCAAFWFGWDDYARQSALLDPTPGDLTRAEAFRRVAQRLSPAETARTDAFIAEQRGLMVLLIDEGMLAAGESRSLMERLLQTCADFAATQPETSGLP